MINVQSAQFDIKKIAESGQCFRLTQIAENHWRLVAFGKILNINVLNDVEYEFHCDEAEFAKVWRDYFDLDTDYSVFVKNVPKGDLYVKAAVDFAEGIRILKQDPWEMLISFIISQRKNIAGIKKCIEALSLQFGEKIENSEIYAFPTSKAIADAPEELLANCSLGYRLQYVYRAAKMVASGELDLDRLALLPQSELSDAALLSQLLSVRGVGPKVAQCVMLFGFHRLGAFPIDVWIEKVIKKHYDNRFPIELYPGFAGVIQQYIFYYARKGDGNE